MNNEQRVAFTATEVAALDSLGVRILGYDPTTGEDHNNGRAMAYGCNEFGRTSTYITKTADGYGLGRHYTKTLPSLREALRHSFVAVPVALDI